MCDILCGVTKIGVVIAGTGPMLLGSFLLEGEVCDEINQLQDPYRMTLEQAKFFNSPEFKKANGVPDGYDLSRAGRNDTYESGYIIYSNGDYEDPAQGLKLEWIPDGMHSYFEVIELPDRNGWHAVLVDQ